MDKYLILLQDSLYRTEAIRKRALKLKSKDYPSTYPMFFLDFVSRISERIIVELNSICENTTRGHIQDKHKGIIVSIWGTTKDIAYLFQFIENCCNEDVPWSLIHPLEKIFLKIVPNDRLIIAAQYQYNYFYYEALEFFIKCLDTLQPGIVDEILVKLTEEYGYEKVANINFILFPKIERTSIFQHVLMGHEIGHRFAYEFYQKFLEEHKFRAMQIKAEGKIREGIKANLKSKLSEVSDGKDRDVLEVSIQIAISEHISRFNQILRFGLEEIFCDVFCIHLFGIASLFAVNAFMASVSNIDSTERDYPPWRYRLRVLYNLIESQNIRQKFENIEFNNSLDLSAESLRAIKLAVEKGLNGIKGIVEEQHDIEKIQSDLLRKAAYDIIGKSLDYINQYVIAQIGAYAESALQLKYEPIIELVSRLKNDIIPNEIPRRPGVSDESIGQITFRQIIIAGWLYRLAFLSGIKNADEYLAATKKVNRLILKAIELSEISSEWIAYNSN